MDLPINLWRILAGVVLFLLGMNFLETGLRGLSGRQFKLFLKRQTAHKMRAIGGGALITGILQSSSVVNLLTLAFVSAGILSLANAFAIMLGSNLGTTVTGWLVATLGFRLNVESLALPLTGLAGIIMMVTPSGRRSNQAARFALGIGLIFEGLAFMKSGVDQAVRDINLAALSQYPLVVFFLAGILITGLIQSSSATIAIGLTALHADLITLRMAAVLVIGSEIGTTLKLVLAAAGASTVAKRVALGNILYNVLIAGLAFAFLGPLLYLVSDLMHIKDPLISLVSFQTLINLFGILLFYPFLKPFARFLGNRWLHTEGDSLYIAKVNPRDTELAILAFGNETRHLLRLIMDYCLSVFNIRNYTVVQEPQEQEFHRKNIADKYEHIKMLHGQIHAFYVRLLAGHITHEETEQVDLLISSVRNGMYAAKSMKDAVPDSRQLLQSSNDIKYHFYMEMRKRVEDHLAALIPLLQQREPLSSSSPLVTRYRLIVTDYNQVLGELYHHGMTRQLSEVEISTIINFNRELFTCLKSLIHAFKGCLLTPAVAADFDELPGFIR